MQLNQDLTKVELILLSVHFIIFLLSFLFSVMFLLLIYFIWFLHFFIISIINCFSRLSSFCFKKLDIANNCQTNLIVAVLVATGV